MPNSAGPAAPLSHGHSTVACPRRHNAQSSPKSKATADSHDVANATARATTQHGACLRTTTSGVHKHARATKRSRGPTGQPKSAYASGISKSSTHTPSKAKARWRSQPRVYQPPETSRASTLLHNVSRETGRPAYQCQVQKHATPSLPQKGGPQRAIAGHQWPSSPGRHHRARSSKRGDAQLARSHHNKPKVQANVDDKVAAILSASVTPCARERSPDAATYRQRAARNSREWAPRERERERPRGHRRQQPPQEGVIRSEVSGPEATSRRCTPDAYSSPARAKRPAVNFKQGPLVSSQDSQTGNKRAVRPYNIRAQQTSRRKRPCMLLLQKDRAARSYSTTEIEKAISQKGSHDANLPAKCLSNASVGKSKPLGLSSSATTPCPNQQSAESSVAEPNTEVQRAKISL